MEKEIKIDIASREDLLEKYNENKVCIDVIEYLVKEAMLVDKEENIKIVQKFPLPLNILAVSATISLEELQE